LDGGSYERLAVVVNENNVYLGFLRLNGKANVVVLFSDPTSVVWLLRRKYETRDFPPPVSEALDEARRSSLLVMAGFAAFILITIGLMIGA